MTLLFNTGFDWVDTTSSATIKAHLAYDGWFFVNEGNTVTAAGGAGLYGGKHVGFAKAGFSGYMGRGLGANYATLIAGFLFKTDALNASVTIVNIFSFMDGATRQVELRLHSNGALSVARNGTILGSATAGGAIAAGTWYFIEVKATFHGSTGAVEVRKDGAAVLTLTGQNTSATGNAYANTVAFNRSQNNANDADLGPVYNDDLYVCDNAGSANNDFLGSCRSELQVPASDVLTGMTPSTGSNHYAVVDEVPLSASADYLTASAAAEDRFGVTALGSTPASIKGVSVISFSLKTDAGTCTARNRLTSGGTTGNGATNATPTALGVSRDVFETDPSTGAAFVPGSMGSIQIGVERVS